MKPFRICRYCTAAATFGLGTHVKSVSGANYHMVELDLFVCAADLEGIKGDYDRRRAIANAHGLPGSIEANFQRIGDPVDWSTLTVFGVPVEMAAFNHEQAGSA